MGGIVRTEEIYDALLDEEAFATLTSRIAAGVDAPSWIVGWVYRDGTQILPDAPRNWAPEILADYAQNFAAIDPWTVAGANNLRPNRAADIANIVSEAEWTRSVLYNELLRPNRLELMHCVFLAGQNETGMGCFALHRERHQTPFSGEAVAALDHLAPHFGRMLALKAKFQRLELIDQMSRLALDGVPQALFVVSSACRLVVHNEAAEQHLRSARVVRLRDGRLEIVGPNADRLRTAIAAATASDRVQASFVLLETGEAERLIASVVPRTVRGARCAMLWLQKLGEPLPDLGQQLGLLFGLTSAEATVAELLAEGRSPAEIAAERATATETVRTQIKSLSAKMGCRRMSEVVAIVRSIPLVR